MGRTVNKGLSTPRPVLPERFLPAELTEINVLRRLGALYVDQTVFVPIHPLYRS